MKTQRPYSRHERLIANLQPIIADFVRTEANVNPLITITNLTISPDYRRLTVYFTAIPEEKEQDALIFLKRKAGDLREHLKHTSRLKIIPHIEFSPDFQEHHRRHIDELMRDAQ